MMMTIKSIDATTAHEWIENNEAVVIDVREPHEYQESHISGSHLIPLATITKSNLPEMAQNKKIIVHCKFGKRGSTACEKLLSEDANLAIYNLEGGITAWENAGYKIEK
jgi:rhodanese-related sulfurtransferase